MKLQLALDRLTKEECYRILDETKDSIDIIEIGTGVIKEYGMSIVREIRKQYPDLTILADMKTCDAGKHEARQVFEAGADITTVMAFASNTTITDMLEVAKEGNHQVMVDLLEIEAKDRIAELSYIGVDLVSLHVGKDKQAKSKFHSGLFSILEGYNFQVAVAGGIDLDTLPDIIPYQPDIVIVGSAITAADAPKEVAKKIKAALSK